MKSSSFFLALDIGTSSLKAGLFDLDYRLVRTTKVDYALTTKGVMISLDPEAIWRAFLQAVQTLGPEAHRAEWVVPCTLSPSVVLMDSKGRALYPAILHWDRRSAREAREALSRVGADRFLARAGNIPYPGSISLGSMLWLARHEPDAMRRAAVIGHMNTYFMHRLTGAWAMDPTNASLTGLYDTVNRSGWIDDFCRETGVSRDKLPPVVECLEWVGKVTTEAARESGLAAGTPVLMGSNDTSSACLGAGVTAPGQILNISGSSEIVALCLDHPSADPKYHLRVHPFPGRWIVFTIMVSGFALEWFRSQLCRDMDEQTFYGEYLESLLAGDRHATVRFAPYLCGDRTSFSTRAGAFSGVTLDTTRDDLAYAMVESTTRHLRSDLRRMAQATTLDPVIRLTGGRASPALARFKERQLPGYRFVERDNCTLLGCAVMSQRAIKGTPAGL